MKLPDDNGGSRTFRHLFIRPLRTVALQPLADLSADEIIAALSVPARIRDVAGVVVGEVWINRLEAS